jgi:m7GpppX diphosphatase
METSPKAAAEALVPLFQFREVLNQDQNGRRISLLGDIHDQPALVTLERAAFPTDPSIIRTFLSGISNTTNLGSNDIYRWYMASHQPSDAEGAGPPDLKLNLIYPCTNAHIKKYRPQPVRMVTETPNIYADLVRPYMLRKREEGRLNWVFNIIEGRTEQEDVILREHAGAAEEDDRNGFLLLPDLNWDRSTAGSLHLLALVERRDIWSLRDLRKRHLPWLRRMRQKILKAAVSIYGEKWGLEEDMLKLYVHCKLAFAAPGGSFPSLFFLAPFSFLSTFFIKGGADFRPPFCQKSQQTSRLTIISTSTL